MSDRIRTRESEHVGASTDPRDTSLHILIYDLTAPSDCGGAQSREALVEIDGRRAPAVPIPCGAQQGAPPTPVERVLRVAAGIHRLRVDLSGSHTHGERSFDAPEPAAASADRLDRSLFIQVWIDRASIRVDRATEGPPLMG
jgi:hypothetical protein